MIGDHESGFTFSTFSKGAGIGETETQEYALVSSRSNANSVMESEVAWA